MATIESSQELAVQTSRLHLVRQGVHSRSLGALHTQLASVLQIEGATLSEIDTDAPCSMSFVNTPCSLADTLFTLRSERTGQESSFSSLLATPVVDLPAQEGALPASTDRTAAARAAYQAGDVELSICVHDQIKRTYSTSCHEILTRSQSKYALESWWKSGLWVLVTGVVASCVAYGIGHGYLALLCVDALIDSTTMFAVVERRAWTLAPPAEPTRKSISRQNLPCVCSRQE